MRVDFNHAWRQVQSIANDIITLLPNMLLGGTILFVTWLLSRYASRLAHSLATRAGQSGNVGLLLGRMAAYAVGIFGFLVALSTIFPSFKARDLIQVLGIGGVAVGFAFKDIFQNFLAGVIILISRPFRIGDTIAVKGYEGTVEDIQTRATLIRTADNKRIVIPNSTVFAQEVTVITAYGARRVEIEFSLGHGANLEAAKSLVLDAMRGVENVEATPAPDVLAMNLVDAGVVLRMRFWVDGRRASVLAVRDGVVSSVKQALEAGGMNFPGQPAPTSAPEPETEGGSPSTTAAWASGENPKRAP